MSQWDPTRQANWGAPQVIVGRSRLVQGSVQGVPKIAYWHVVRPTAEPRPLDQAQQCLCGSWTDPAHWDLVAVPVAEFDPQAQQPLHAACAEKMGWITRGRPPTNRRRPSTLDHYL
jgi:hypothetical protein